MKVRIYSESANYTLAGCIEVNAERALLVNSSVIGGYPTYELSAGTVYINVDAVTAVRVDAEQSTGGQATG